MLSMFQMIKKNIDIQIANSPFTVSVYATVTKTEVPTRFGEDNSIFDIMY